MIGPPLGSGRPAGGEIVAEPAAPADAVLGGDPVGRVPVPRGGG